MNNNEQTFLKNLGRFSRRLLWLQLFGGLWRFGLLLLALWSSVALADQLFHFSSLTRWGLWILNAVIVIYVFVRLAGGPLKKLTQFHANSDLTPFARILSSFYPQAGDAIVTAYQLLTGREQSGTSDVLRQNAIRQTLEPLGDQYFSKHLRLRMFLPAPWLSVSVIAAVALLTVFHFSEFKRSTLRLLNPAGEYALQPVYEFSVVPGDTSVVKGSNLHIKAAYRGPQLSACYLVLQKSPAKQNGPRLKMQKKDSLYIIALKDIRQNEIYYLEGLALRQNLYDAAFTSQRFHIQVRIPPLVTELTVSLQPPAYTQMAVQHLEKNVGDVSGVPGAKVQLRATVNKTLAGAHLAFDSGKTTELHIRGRQVRGAFIIRTEDEYRIVLKDSSGLANRNPIVYHILPLPDSPPTVEIIKPGTDLETAPDVILPVKISANDDYGLRRMWFLQRLLPQGKAGQDSQWQKTVLPLPDGNAAQQEVSYDWDLNALPVAFGDALEYYVRVQDNNTFSGPGFGNSAVFRVNFPSLEETFNDFEQKQEEESKKLQDVSQKARELKKEIEKLDREMLREQKLDWEKKQQLEKTLQRQKEMHKKLEEIKRELDKQVQKLEDKNIISPEILEKYKELQKLLNEVVTPELLAAMQKLKQALSEQDAQKVKQALKQLKLNQEAFEKSIERAMELLRQVQFEQKLDQLVQQARNLKKQQEKITRQIEQKPHSAAQKEQAVKSQQQQQKEFEALRKALRDFRQEPNLSQYSKAKQTLDSLNRQMQQSSIPSEMKSVQQALQQNQNRQAAQQSQQLQQQFSRMQQALQQSQQNILQQHKQQIKKEMLRNIMQMLELSRQQEALMKQSEKLTPMSDQYRRIAERQQEVRQNLNKVAGDLVKLSHKTFFISPKMSAYLNVAQRGMDGALGQLSERSKQGARQNQRRALAGLNKSIMQMRQSLLQLSKSQSGTGFEQFLKMLQQMAKAQGQLNDQSMNLFQGKGQGGLTSEQMQQMRRLAARQAALSQAMKQLSENMGQRKDMLGRVDQLSEEMDKVVKDLLKNNLNRKTIERQRQILSRLLDAQKSMKEKEYSQKRKAERGEPFKARDPGKLGATAEAEKMLIEQAMRRALNAGYSSDLRPLIEAYFNELLRQYKTKQETP